jgi:hypothetical protein
VTTETQAPDDWVLLEAAKRSGWNNPTAKRGRAFYANPYQLTEGRCYRALCDMIAKHEKPPVDRKLLCAREAVKPFEDKSRGSVGGYISIDLLESYVVHAIKLFEEGFGK